MIAPPDSSLEKTHKAISLHGNSCHGNLKGRPGEAKQEEDKSQKLKTTF